MAGPGSWRRASDADIVAAANAGDGDAMEAIYARHRDWVLSLAFRYTGNHEDALDVLQETFAYVFGKFPGFELRAKMTTFLFPAVRNLSLARVRKRGRTVPLEAEPASPDPKGRAAGSGFPPAVSRLPEREREIVMLRFADGFTLAEIAAALDIPLGTVKSRLHKALSRLRQSLSGSRDA
ncbi:MAG: RNA polymerase sigma factor [Planctomycetota bacterium]|jgi:RNA polymerase sigma-70 factor (ECF subfamily)